MDALSLSVRANSRKARVKLLGATTWRGLLAPRDLVKGASTVAFAAVFLRGMAHPVDHGRQVGDLAFFRLLEPSSIGRFP
jgi:hypothetical protein